MHFVDLDFKLRSHVLGCPRFEGKHEASRILELTTSVIDEFGLRNKLFFVGVDNGANMLKAFRDLKAMTSMDDGEETDLSSKATNKIMLAINCVK